LKERRRTLIPAFSAPRSNRKLEAEDLVKDFESHPDDTITQRAARLEVNRDTIYTLIRREELKGLLSKDKNIQNRIIKRLEEAGKRIQEYEQEQHIQSVEDNALLKIHQGRIDESTLNPLRQAKAILYHIDRLLALLVSDVDRNLRTIKEVHAKQIANSSEFSDKEKKTCLDAIFFFGNINSTIKSVDRLTSSTSRAWDMVLEFQARDIIQPATILDILAKRLKELHPDVLDQIANDFRDIQRQQFGIVPSPQATSDDSEL
jgi:pyruvate/2-oxoacid:ferredoxin oxidoreductase alpha subunit